MLLPVVVAAQSGKAVYQQTIKGKYLEYKWERKYEWELIFTDTSSICKAVPIKAAEISAGGITIGTSNETPKDLYLTRYGDTVAITDLVDDGTIYLVSDTALNAITWKFTGKQGLVAAYPCMELVTNLFVDSAWVWFTPQVALPTGPLDWRGAPGLVLHVETDRGNNVVTLKSLDLNYQPKQEDFEVVWPKKSKKITLAALFGQRNTAKQRKRAVYGEY